MEQIGAAVRSHWGVENGLHWVLDMVFRDDECRIRTGHAPANFATIKHMASNLLRRGKDVPRGTLHAILRRSIDDRTLCARAASELAGSNVFRIEPDTNVGFAIRLKQRREAMGMSQSEVAERLGISYRTYRRIEDPARSNPTLKTILKIEKIFEHRLVHIE